MPSQNCQKRWSFHCPRRFLQCTFHQLTTITHLSWIYLRAGESTVSYAHSYQVQNTLLWINYMLFHCHGVRRLWPLPSPVMCQLLNQVHRRHLYTMGNDACVWFGPIPSKSQVVGSVIGGENKLRFGVRTNRRAGWILTDRGGVDA